MIKAIIFDLGGVLLEDPQPGMIVHYSKNLNVTKEKFLEVFAQYEADWQKGKFSEEQFWDRITTCLHRTKPQVESLWLDGILSVYKEKKEVFDLIKKLKQYGYTIALLTNTEIPVMNYIKKLKWEDFDLFIYSCEVGMRKPERKIYELALQKLKIQPGEAVFIDDKQENINAAEEVGIHGIVFENANQLSEQLRNVGIAI